MYVCMGLMQQTVKAFSTCNTIIYLDETNIFYKLTPHNSLALEPLNFP